MQTWLFTTSDLHTVVGEKTETSIRLQGNHGCGLFGPYLDISPGVCTARILLEGHREGLVTMDIAADSGSTVLISHSFDLGKVEGSALELHARITEQMRQCEIRLHCQSGACAEIVAVEIHLSRSEPTTLDPHRPVGYESRKTYVNKINNGFFSKYLSGEAILEIGYKGYIDGTVPILPQAIGVDVDYPGYDGVRLPFPDESQDAIYSSHCFEHIDEHQDVLRDWYRVLKVGGYLIIVVPHQYLFERRRYMPSAWNKDHKRFYTPASLLREIEEAFAPNSYRIRHLSDNDLGFDYSVHPLEAGFGSYEIELVVEKLKKPTWDLEDGTSRGYNAVEFDSCIERKIPWHIESDFSLTDRCIVYGPYIALDAGEFDAKYFIEAIGIGDQALQSDITLDIGQDTQGIASVALTGAEGAETLRSGSVTLRFRNSVAGSHFEFRVYTSGQPFHGRLRFYGVLLNRIWPRE